MINEHGLTPKQQKFVNAYMETGNATEAVKMAGYKYSGDNSAAVTGHTNLRKAKILAFLEEKSEVAASIIFELAQSAENETVRLNASKDIMDRSGFKPTDKSELEVTAPKPLLDAFFNNNSNKETFNTHEEN